MYMYKEELIKKFVKCIICIIKYICMEIYL